MQWKGQGTVTATCTDLGVKVRSVWRGAINTGSGRRERFFSMAALADVVIACFGFGRVVKEPLWDFRVDIQGWTLGVS